MVAQVEGYVWMRRQRLAAAGARQRRRHAAGGGVFARCCSSRGPLFYELAESWRGGASARAGPFYPAEKVYVCRNSYLDHSQDILAKPQNIFLEKKSPRGHLAKSSKIYSHSLGIAIFFWLSYCNICTIMIEVDVELLYVPYSLSLTDCVNCVTV